MRWPRDAQSHGHNHHSPSVSSDGHEYPLAIGWQSIVDCMWCAILLDVYARARVHGVSEGAAVLIAPFVLMGRPPFALDVDDVMCCAFHLATRSNATAHLRGAE